MPWLQRRKVAEFAVGTEQSDRQRIRLHGESRCIPGIFVWDEHMGT